VYKEQTNRYLLYVTALYWTVTTLATVGYGDVKGFTWQEYCFNMFVEFIGIAFFSFVMGSINSIFMADNITIISVSNRMEEVDVWLVKLD
jgi:voltage-gated potassium channel